jgi:hypothetical protein
MSGKRWLSTRQECRVRLRRREIKLCLQLRPPSPRVHQGGATRSCHAQHDAAQTRPTARIASASLIAQAFGVSVSSQPRHMTSATRFRMSAAYEAQKHHPAAPDIFYVRQASPKLRAKLCADVEQRSVINPGLPQIAGKNVRSKTRRWSPYVCVSRASTPNFEMTGTQCAFARDVTMLSGVMAVG